MRESSTASLFLGLQCAADRLLRDAEALFKSAGLTAPQYNVLRILRGARGEGLASCEISARMISREPDIARLLDRLAARDLVTRERLENDRRVVKTRISEKGLELLASLDPAVRTLHERQFAALTQAERASLGEILSRLNPSC